MTHLASFQTTFMNLVLLADETVLESHDAFVAWLNTQTSLSKDLRNSFLAQPLERLAQYQYMVQANLSDTLEGIYPLTHQLLRDTWSDLTTTYRLTRLPRAYQLFECVKAFPDFLKTQAVVLQAYPYVVDLACYECSEVDVLRMQTVPFEFPEALPRLSPKTLASLSPILNPTTQLLTLSYPIVEIVDSLKAGDIPTNINPTELTLAVFRDQAYEAIFFRLAPLASEFLKVLQDNPGFSYEQLLQSALTKSQFVGDYNGLLTSFIAYLDKLHSRGVLLSAISLKAF